MAHFGLICPPVSGHLNPMTTLGRELLRRGHRITVFGIPDAESRVAPGFQFQPYGAGEFPIGSMVTMLAGFGVASGAVAVKQTIAAACRDVDAQLAELPNAVRQFEIDAIIADKASPAAGTIADVTGRPYVTIANSLMPELSPDIPPAGFGWRHVEGGLARARNRFGNALHVAIAWPLLRRLNAFRGRHDLSLYRQPVDWCSQRLRVAQWPEVFELPARQRSQFVYVGPLHDDESRASTPFPYEKLTGEPLVYASLGTLHNRRHDIFDRIVRATAGLGVQVVMSFGRADADVRADLPAHVLAVPFAPQLELLKRATLTITHAGLNTVLESLSAGVPVVALPVSNDQPGVAERVRYHGVGIAVGTGWAAIGNLRHAVDTVLRDPEYGRRAKALAQAIAKTGRAALAADLIEARCLNGKVGVA
jgi:zeaxanthin glucosyltransferase